jgi:environmental stress-induced protein Ves
MLQLLTQENYSSTPWKNGKGITQDVLLLPAGASHEDFDIRISISPIVGEAPFSAFPGIERTITCLSDNPVVLVFAGNSEVRLDPLMPFRFDSDLSPSTRLPAGEGRVLNVMARRGRWNAAVKILHGAVDKVVDVPAGGLAVVHAARGDCEVAGLHVGLGQSLIARDVAEIQVSAGEGCSVLVATIEQAHFD